MRFSWPKDTAFTSLVLTVEQKHCAGCQRRLQICDHRFHRIHSLSGPVEIVCKLVHCPDAACPDHAHTISPESELQVTLPRWTIGWDLFCWLGHRRFARHWSVPQLRRELLDSYGIPLSEDTLARYLRHYQNMVAARHQDAEQLRAAYRDIPELILTIDGLQPEKGHETLYVVRELRGQRVWFAEALLSSTTSEVQRLVAKAKEWAKELGKPVALWMSDKQEAFVHAIREEFPEVPHRYCQNHFLRDVAKPMLEADSHAKVTMRRKVRGLRAIERDVLAQQAASETPSAESSAPVGAEAPESSPSLEAASVSPSAADPGAGLNPIGQVVLDYCAAVRGILNDDQGGPLSPPGLRMAEGLQEVRGSLQRNLDAKKGGALRTNCSDWPTASTVAWRK